MADFFESLGIVIAELPLYSVFSLPELVEKAKNHGLTVNDWDGRDHASLGREFFNQLTIFSTADCQIVPIAGKNPQKYQKRPTEQPIVLDDFSTEINVSVAELQKVLLLLGKTLAIISRG
jgi:hypothetical protein